MSASSTEFLRVELSEHIATVTLARPPVNAINRAVMSEMIEVFGSIADEWNVRAVIFASACERAFCGGVDLKQVGAPSGSTEREPRPTDSGKLARNAMWAILDCPVPVIAAVNGPALGAGLAFVACCDVIVASERAQFGCPEIDVGLLGAGSHLQRMVGPYRMRELYYTGRRVPAAEMYEYGGISRVVPHDDLAAAARRIASEIASKSPPAIRLAKESLARVEWLPLKDAYRTEQDYTARLGRYEDSAEARKAFLERRPPKFAGR
jgi:enoyl-CoA hydratase